MVTRAAGGGGDGEPKRRLTIEGLASGMSGRTDGDAAAGGWWRWRNRGDGCNWKDSRSGMSGRTDGDAAAAVVAMENRRDG